MNRTIKYKDLGLIDYKEAWDYQETLFNTILSTKNQNRDLPAENQLPTSNHLLFCEHPHVLTIGKSGSENNLLIDEQLMQQKGISYYRINRGGDITYHGPGQIVGYPILDLENYSLGLKNYIRILEEAVIQVLAESGIKSERFPGATGVWLDVNEADKTRKICAIGVRASRHITMHGFAFNVNTTLSYYQYINPCGFIDKGVTSMEKELGARQDMNQVKKLLKAKLGSLLKAEII